MRGDTHILGGVTLATGVTLISGIYMPQNIEQSKVSFLVFGSYLLGAGIGAVLPDIDKKGSTVSNRAKIVSFISRVLFTHRGFTHSLLAMLILCAVLLPIGYYSPNQNFLPFMVGIIVGFDSHLLLDSLNPTGIMLFYPFNIHISFARINTGGLIEKLFKILLFICLIFFLKMVLERVITLEQIKRYFFDIPIVNKIMS